MSEMENKTAQEMEIPTTYTLRPLCDEELYPMLGILSKVIPDELADAFVGVVSEEKTLDEIGYDVGCKIVVEIIKNLPTVGDEVYAFLSSVSGIAPEILRKMKFGTTPKMIWEIYNEVKNSDFFVAVSKSS